MWDRLNTIPDDNFALMVATHVTDDTPDPISILECQSRPDWPQWQTAINSELDSLISRDTFGPEVPIPRDAHLIGYKYTFVRKQNDKGQVVRYKARLVGKGFTQRPGEHYDQTYSPVMDSITFRFLISFANFHKLRMRQLDVATAYLYGTLDTTIYMRAPPELEARRRVVAQGATSHIPMLQKHILNTPHINMRQDTKVSLDAQASTSTSVPISNDATASTSTKVQHGIKMPAVRHTPSGLAIRVLKALYGLKQSGRVWYQKFTDEMINMGFTHDEIAPCIFIKQVQKEFVIVAIYVDDLNIFGTHKLTDQTIEMLKSTFEMKDLGDTKFCLGLQLEVLPTGFLLHQTTYTEKILKQFNMQLSHPLASPMVVRSLENKDDVFRKAEENEPILGPETPYLSVTGALMHLANQTRPDISFPTNLLARHSATPTTRHWKGIKHILRYLRGNTDLGLFYPFNTNQNIVGYADAGYLSDTDTAKSQTGYVYLIGGTAFSWKSAKQTLTATSSTHAEILALHEASREAVWLRSLISHIQVNCGLEPLTQPTNIFEDNTACIQQIKQGFIKGDRVKHVAPKFFYTHELHGKEINVTQISSADNCADLFTKSLPPSVHHRHCRAIGLRSLRQLMSEE